MIVLADNDVIHKLACCDLLPELMLWLKAPPNQVLVLPGLRFVLRRKLKADKVALECFEDFLNKTQEIPQAPIALMERFDLLDVGERQMLAVLIDNKKVSQMVTGDKRALKVIGDMHLADADLSSRLSETRIDCLESIMLGLIEQFGFNAINVKAARGLKADGVLGMSFGGKRTQAHAEDALRSYLNEVRATAPFVES